MKEIKFRAWDNKEKKWLFGYDLPNLGGFSLFGEVMLLDEWSSVLDTVLFSRNGYKPEDLVVMQFTGLKDKNGKEIYEGDVLTSLYKTDGCNGLYEVRWSEIRCAFFPKKHGSHQQINVSITPSDLQRCEIIGNIYENPAVLAVAESEANEHA